MNMVIGKGNKKILIIIASIIGVVIIASSVFAIAAWQSQQAETEDPYSEVSVEDSSEAEPAEQTDPEAETTVEEEPVATIDPANVSTVDIVPLEVTVSYVKGIPGFEYTVKRTQGSTQYVDFNAPDLVGTKCTDDTGVFASIVKNPDSQEDKTTLIVTKKVGDDTYGLSLSGTNCTSDTALLGQYQSSFKDAFGLLKAYTPSSSE